MNERTQYTITITHIPSHFAIVWAGQRIGNVSWGSSCEKYGAALSDAMPYQYIGSAKTFHEAFDLVVSAHQAELFNLEQALFEEECFDALAYAAARLQLEYVPMSGTSEEDAESELDSMVKRLCQRLSALTPTQLAEYLHHDAHTQEANG